MKQDYRKLLKVIRHPENLSTHVQTIENMIDMFTEKWKDHLEHPLFLKAHARVEAELQWLKDTLTYDQYE